MTKNFYTLFSVFGVALILLGPLAADQWDEVRALWRQEQQDQDAKDDAWRQQEKDDAYNRDAWRQQQWRDSYKRDAYKRDAYRQDEWRRSYYNR